MQGRTGNRSIAGRSMRAISLVALGVAAASADAGGILMYEVGTADVGLASAGYSARAQDASTVLTNPAGMTRLDGNQLLVAGQVLWSNAKFSMDSATSPALGTGGSGYIVGENGWFLGGGPFFTYSVSPDLKLGFALTGNFGMPLNYNDEWAGRYYVQEATMLGISFLPSIAYKVTDKLSVGATLNAMYGIYRNQVAINNVLPGYQDGTLRMQDETWGWGATLGVLYQLDARTRLGFTWTSQMNLDFNAPAEFNNLAPGVHALLKSRGLLDSSIAVGIKVPQQLMGSVYAEVNDRWAVLGSVGWQQWSRFGQVELGLDDALNPTSVTKNLEFKDTWHVALGAQYRYSEPWLVNFGMAYDSKFQTGNVSPLLPVNDAWRFGAGAEQRLSKNNFWGFAGEYIYGGTLDTNLQSQLPVAAGGRGNLVGSYNNGGVLYLSAYYNWKF
jgi:long-chain fatty acid transport protein